MSSEKIEDKSSKEKIESQNDDQQKSQAPEENEQKMEVIYEEGEDNINQIIEDVQLVDNEEPEEPIEMRQASSLTSEYFLNKHSPSFKCFEQYLCSQSDLKMTLNFFPPLTDPGLDDALNYIPPEDVPDPTGVERYVKMCKYLEIVPIKRVIRSLTTDTLNLKYYGLTVKQMRGITDALKVNSIVVNVIFEDNWMTPEATSLISEILSESNSLRTLNLKECRIGEQGAEMLSEGISATQFLRELDLSFNSLGDKGLKLLRWGLEDNTSIKKLNLSHNNLTEVSGPILEEIFVENKCLEEVDLSWNGFFTGPGNKKLFNGLVKNELITWLSLAWNGIGNPAAVRPMRKYLKTTQTLKFLDLSFNRLAQESLRIIRTSLLKNTSLTEVKIGNNIYAPDEAYSLASVLTKVDKLVLLDMEDMCVNKDFLTLKSEIIRARKTVIHGRVLRNYVIRGPNANKLLFQRCRFLAMKPKKKKAKKDFGHFILTLPDNVVTKEEFEKILKTVKVKKIDTDILNELMARFPAKNGRVDSVSMKAAYMALYPDTVLPEVKEKKATGKKKGGKKK